MPALSGTGLFTIPWTEHSLRPPLPTMVHHLCWALPQRVNQEPTGPHSLHLTQVSIGARAWPAAALHCMQLVGWVGHISRCLWAQHQSKQCRRVAYTGPWMVSAAAVTCMAAAFVCAGAASNAARVGFYWPNCTYTTSRALHSLRTYLSHQLSAFSLSPFLPLSGYSPVATSNLCRARRCLPAPHQPAVVTPQHRAPPPQSDVICVSSNSLAGGTPCSSQWDRHSQPRSEGSYGGP